MPLFSSVSVTLVDSIFHATMLPSLPPDRSTEPQEEKAKAVMLLLPLASGLKCASVAKQLPASLMVVPHQYKEE